MKLFIIFLAIVGLSYGASIPAAGKGTLREAWDELDAYIDEDQIVELVKVYIANDAEVKEIYDYLNSDKFKAIVAKIRVVPEIVSLFQYVESKGVPAKELLNKLGLIFGIPPIPFARSQSTRGWRDLYSELDEILNFKKILERLVTLVQTNDEVNELFVKIASSQAVAEKILAYPEVQALVKTLRERGVDVDKVIDAVKAFFGWTRMSSAFAKGTLREAWDELDAYIDEDQIVELVKVYIANDAEVKEIYDYLNSDKFKVIVAKIRVVPEIVSLFQYVESKGVPAKELLNKLGLIFGIPPIPFARSQNTRGWRDLYSELDEILNFKKILERLVTLVQTNDEVNELFVKIASSQAVAEKILAYPEVQALVKTLRERGVDVDKVIDAVKAFFGWTRKLSTFAKGTLREAWDELDAYIDEDQIVELVKVYIANDAEVKEIYDYLNSDKFKAIVAKIRVVPEIVSLFQYVESKGVPAKELLNKLGLIFGIPPIPFSRSQNTRGWRDLYSELDEILNFKKILERLVTLVQTNDEVNELFVKIASSQAVAEKILAYPEVQALVKTLRERGVDVDKVIDAVKAFFGWTRMSSTFAKGTLREAWDELDAYIDEDQIVELVKVYIANDAEVKEIYDYLNSDKFKAIVAKIRVVPEIVSLFQYVESKGVPIKDLLNKLGLIFGIPPIPFARSQNTRGWRDLYSELDEILNFKKMLERLVTLVQTNDEVNELFVKIASSQAVAEKILAYPEVQALVKTLRERGVDVDKVLDAVKAFFGWTRKLSTFAKGTLREAWDELDAYIDEDQIVELVKVYIANDAEVKEIYDYLNSDKFKAIVAKIRVVPEIVSLFQYVESKGVPAKELLNKLGLIFGIPPIPFARSQNTRGWRDLLSELDEILNFKKILERLVTLVQTNDEVNELFVKIASNQAVADKILAYPEVQALVKTLRERGVDVDKVIDAINAFFGWK